MNNFEKKPTAIKITKYYSGGGGSGRGDNGDGGSSSSSAVSVANDIIMQ